MGNMKIHEARPPATPATPPVLGLPPPSSRNQVNSCWIDPSAPAATENSCNMKAVVVLISHGENGFGGLTSAGGPMANASAGASQLEDLKPELGVVGGDPAATGLHDVVWGWS